MIDFFIDFQSRFIATFLTDSRWVNFAKGLGNTLLLALFATLIGILIGTLVGIIRVYHAQTGKWRIADAIVRAYVSIIRGTPVIVQLMILYYGVFASWSRDMVLVIGIIGFGLNSGAYVSEIIRGGILSIDFGQTEAGRSLGLSQAQTMRHIILPQALKNALPALGNEFIVLLKETSVASTITVLDLTRAADVVRSRTYDPFFALIAVALMYWILVTGMTRLLNLAERRLAKSDRT